MVYITKTLKLSEYLKQEPTGLPADLLIRSIKQVTRDDANNRIITINNDGCEVIYYYNGFVKRSYRRGDKIVHKKPYMVKDDYDRRVRVVVGGGKKKSMLFERAIAILICVSQDAIPENIDSLEANCIDSSGNYDTAVEYGIVPWNFNPRNIELVPKEVNDSHKYLVRALWNLTGKYTTLSMCNEEAVNRITKAIEMASC